MTTDAGEIALTWLSGDVRPQDAGPVLRSRSWVLRFRRDGKPRRVTLGHAGTVTPDQARAAALALLAREKADGPSLPLPASGPTLARIAPRGDG